MPCSVCSRLTVVINHSYYSDDADNDGEYLTESGGCVESTSRGDFARESEYDLASESDPRDIKTKCAQTCRNSGTKYAAARFYQVGSITL